VLEVEGVASSVTVDRDDAYPAADLLADHGRS
jgi:hypothetical protein